MLLPRLMTVLGHGGACLRPGMLRLSRSALGHPGIASPAAESAAFRPWVLHGCILLRRAPGLWFLAACVQASDLGGERRKAAAEVGISQGLSVVGLRSACRAATQASTGD